MRNLPPDYLYRNIPDAIVSEDVRKLLRAVVGGFQDRYSELRFLADQLALIWDPANRIGDPAQVLVVDYFDEDGEARQYVLTKTESAPDTAAQSAETLSWAASEMEIAVDQISSAQWTTDSNRAAEGTTYQLLADTIGAALYDPIDLDLTRENHLLILQTHFKRVKRKGTKSSFGDLARLHGFTHYAVTPLWSRLSARNPSNVGLPENDADYRAQPQGLPSPGEKTDLYDIDDLADGEPFTWTSSALGISPSQSNYILTGVNGLNPFIRVVAATATLALPSAATYVLKNGGPGKRASTGSIKTALGLDSGFEIEAIAPGSSFNGARILISSVSADSIQIDVTHNLSTIKFRSNLFDYSAAVSEQVYARKNTGLVGLSQDLEDNPDVWKRLSQNLPQDSVGYYNSGVALDPYRPWSGGYKPLPTVVTWPHYSFTAGSGLSDKRSQARLDQEALIVSPLLAAARRLTASIDDVRPATRFPRRVSTGIVYETIVQYSPHVGRELLAIIQSPVTIGATIGPEGTAYPYKPLSGSFFVRIKLVKLEFSGSWKAAQTSIKEHAVTTESDPDNPDIVYIKFEHPDDYRILSFSGTFNFSSMTLSISATHAGYSQSGAQYQTTGSLYASWEALGTDAFQKEPAQDTPDVLTLYTTP